MADRDDEWGPDTGVEMANPTKRQTSPHGVAVQRGGGQSPSARAAFAKIQELDKKFDEHSRADKEALAAINTELKNQAVGISGMKSSVDTMVSEMRHQRELKLAELRGEVDLVVAEGEVTAQVEKQKTDREKISTRSKIYIAAIATAGTGLGVFAKWVIDKLA